MSKYIDVTFWGVRGSVPVPGKDTVAYGGNTPCIEVKTPEQHFVFDAGTGIRELGQSLMRREEQTELDIFITHTHWDHIQGFPFFVPIFSPENKFCLTGPEQQELDPSKDAVMDFRKLMENQMQFSVFPVSLEEVEQRAELSYRSIGEDSFSIGDCRIKTQAVNHTSFTLGYRVELGDLVLVYTGDNEPYYNQLRHGGDDEVDPERLERMDQKVEEMNQRFYDFCSGADLVIADAQYTPEEYPDRRGWGHSTNQHCINLAREARPDQLVFFHHEPTRTDDELKQLEERTLKQLREKTGGETEGKFAEEGMEIRLQNE